MKIVVLDGYTENPGDLSWAGLEALGEVTVYDRTSYVEAPIIAERIGDAEVVYTNKTPISKETLDQCPNVEFIGVLATGYNVVDVVAAKERGIPVANIPSYGTDAVGQYTIALLLELCHHIGEHSACVKRGEWTNNADWCFWNYPLIELAGKKMGIIGFGMIGKYLAEYAYGCGMEVYAYDAFAIAEETARQYHAQISTLEDILTDCDYISLHVPLLESTRNMISTEEFKKMKKDACLLNAARGGIVNEEALYEALKKKEIRSACFDVYSSEPPREDDKLLTLDNFLLTPHTAARSMESEQRTCAMSTDIILEQLIGN